MAMTMKTVMTWDTKPGVSAIEAARAAYIATALAAGDTDGVVTNFGPNSYSRAWRDSAAAKAWSDFIVATAATNGRTVIVATSTI